MTTLLSIRDFQSIKSLDVEIKGLVAVVGPSNSGKSAVVRAFRAAATNPRGASFVRSGTPQAEVAITDNLNGGDPSQSLGSGFRYVKGAKGPVVYETAEGEHSAIGSGPPPEIVGAYLDMDLDVQVSDQFDPPFMLTLTPSRASAVLGSLTRAYLLAEAVQSVNKLARDARSEATVLTGEHLEAAEALAVTEDFATTWVPHVQDVLEEHEECVRRAEALSRASGKLAQVRALAPRLKAAVAAGNALGDLPQLSQRLSAIEERASRVRGVSQPLAGAVAEYSRHISQAAKALPEIEEARRRLDDLVGGMAVCPTCGGVLDDEARHVLAGGGVAEAKG